MPVYSFKNRKTGEYFDKELKIDEIENFLIDNPDYVSIIQPVGFVSGRKTNFTLDNNLKGVYDNIKRNHPHNKMDY